MNSMQEDKLTKKAISSVVWKLGERILAQLVSLLVSIILARILTPSDYSEVSIVTIFFAFANVLVSGGLNSSLIQSRTEDKKDYSSVLILCIIISVIVYLILFFVSPFISILYSDDNLILLIRIMGLSLPITAIKSIWCAYISNKLQFKKFFWATFGGTVFSGLIGIYLAINGAGAWALVAQQMSNIFIDTIILIITTRIPLTIYFSLKRIKPLISYGWKLLLASLISVAYDQTMPLVIGLKFSKTDLAYYSKGQSIPLLLSNTSSQTISAVLFPVMSKIQNDRLEVLRYTRQFMSIVSFIVFPLMLGFFVVSNTFVRVVLTPKWIECVPYIRVFCIAYLFEMLNIGNLQSIRAMGRSDIILKMEIIKKVLYFITILTFVVFSKSPLIVAFSTIVTGVIALIVNTYPSTFLFDYSYKKQVLDVAQNFFSAVLMAIVVAVLGMFEMNEILLLFIQCLVGLVVYLTIGIMTHNKTLKLLLTFLHNTVRSKRQKE